VAEPRRDPLGDAGTAAFCAGFKDRGFLRESAPADIVIYNLERLKVLPVEIANDLPGNEWRRVQRADGYSHVIVNGQITLGERPIHGRNSG
jgi:N-acyl-D-amino-acid deacylase